MISEHAEGHRKKKLRALHLFFDAHWNINYKILMKDACWMVCQVRPLSL